MASGCRNCVKEIVRQPYNFSSPGSVREVEEYRAELSDVTLLELTTNPDIAGRVSRASAKTSAYLNQPNRCARCRCISQWPAGFFGTPLVSGHTGICES